MRVQVSSKCIDSDGAGPRIVKQLIDIKTERPSVLTIPALHPVAHHLFVLSEVKFTGHRGDVLIPGGNINCVVLRAVVHHNEVAHSDPNMIVQKFFQPHCAVTNQKQGNNTVRWRIHRPADMSHRPGNSLRRVPYPGVLLGKTVPQAGIFHHTWHQLKPPQCLPRQLQV